MSPRRVFPRLLSLAAGLCAAVAVALPALATFSPGPAYLLPGTPLDTSVADFAAPGTQPGGLNFQIDSWASCSFCHFQYDEGTEPGTRWLHSMMGQSARDPIFHAALTIAEQDAPGSGDMCIRCHAPGGWLAGHGTPTDGSGLFGKDFEGVSCQFCHRMVDPVFDASENPAVDAAILAGLASPPTTEVHTGMFVVDPEDRRRGPFELDQFFPWHQWLESPFHQESLLCATCHDVSNPAFDRVGGATPSASDTYVLNATKAAHTSADKFEQFPIERTFSEWANSAFAQGPVNMGGKFGGNKAAVSSCQDCHMPDTSGYGCAPGFAGEYREDLPRHDFNGANSWVLEAILDLDQSLLLYGPGEVSMMQPQFVADAIQRNKDMLAAASELDLSVANGELVARITNDTGHKLPTGYGEGRRMWIHVEFRDASGTLIQEHGAYDDLTATLTTGDTKVYEIKHGMDATVASNSGNTPGPSFHFVLNNVIEKDNRIPPRGFTNAAFEAVQSHPVGATYADGQYWDDTPYTIPCGAATARVRVYHQTTTKEYIEFLRDENSTDLKGQIAYDLWVANGMSEPVLMDDESIDLLPLLTGDVDTVSLSLGGQQQLCLNAGLAHAGDVYWVIGSITGTSPGIPIGSVTIPLNFDLYTSMTITGANNPPVLTSFGVVDGVGTAATTFVVPPGSSGPALLGLTGNHAAVLMHPATFAVLDASNPVPVLLGP